MAAVGLSGARLRAGAGALGLVALLSCYGFCAAEVLPRCAFDDLWVAAETDRVTLIGNVPAGEASTYARNLDALSEALEARGRGLRGAGIGRVTIYAFAGRSCFAPFRSVRDGRPVDAAGLFRVRDLGNVLLFQTADWGGDLHVIYHEYVHALTSSVTQDLPLCLNEGLADYFSTFTHGDQSADVGAPPEGYADILESHGTVPLDQLFAIREDSPDYLHSGDPRQTFYAESWALIHYLNRSSADVERFPHLLEGIESGLTPKDAFTRAYPDERWETMHEQLAAYIRSRQYSRAWGYDFARPFTQLPVTIRRLDPAEVRDRLLDLAWGADSSRAADVRAELASAVGADSSRAGAMMLLGRLEEDMGRPQAAESCFRRALATGADDFEVQLGVGLTRLRRAEAAEQRLQPDMRRAARAPLARAVEIDPVSIEAASALAWTYVLEDSVPPSVRAAIERARGAFPARRDLALLQRNLRTREDVGRIHRAHQWADAHRYREADSLLAWVADSALVPEVRDQARRDRKIVAHNEAVYDYNLGVDAVERGSLEEAARWFRKARDRAPDDNIGKLADQRLSELGAARAGLPPSGRARR